MTATLTVGAENLSNAQPDFVEMLPTIQQVARFAFRHLRRDVREERLAEVIARAYEMFQRLVERGKAALAYASVLARYAIRQVRDGRRVGSKRNVLDVLSSYSQRRKGFSVQPLGEATKRSAWEELVANDRHASPAEIASFKIDFTEWLKRLKRSKRQVALRLAAGDTTSEVAGHFRLSSSRVSQLRKELQQDWDLFQAIPAEA
jgi:hypothetical protein